MTETRQHANGQMNVLFTLFSSSVDLHSSVFCNTRNQSLIFVYVTCPCRGELSCQPSRSLKVTLAVRKSAHLKVNVSKGFVPSVLARCNRDSISWLREVNDLELGCDSESKK